MKRWGFHPLNIESPIYGVLNIHRSNTIPGGLNGSIFHMNGMGWVFQRTWKMTQRLKNLKDSEIEPWPLSSDIPGKVSLVIKRDNGKIRHAIFDDFKKRNLYGVRLKMLCTPVNPMVLLIMIPMNNGYFIGNINPTFSDIPIYKPPGQWISQPCLLG